MATWTSDELGRIEKADELVIAPLRRDGTRGKAVTIWVVREGDDLYVRSAYGRNATWFRGAQARHEGRIQAGGVTMDVRLLDADPKLNDAIDAAYRTKYRHHGAQYVNMMISADARATTLKLAPR
jgi:hypothetical protein